MIKNNHKKAKVDKCHLLFTRDTDVTAKIIEFNAKNSREKTYWCQNRHQAFFRESCFFTLPEDKPKVTCTRKSRTFYGSSKT